MLDQDIPNKSYYTQYISELEQEIIMKDLLISELRDEVHVQKSIAKGMQLLNMALARPS